MDLMIDLETLGTAPDAAFVELGAIAFDIDARPGSIIEALLVSPVAPHPSACVDLDSVRWWMCRCAKTGKAAWASQTALVVSEAEALDRLNDFVRRLMALGHTVKRVWTRGGDLDIAVLCMAAKRNNRHLPWRHSNARDVRTLLDVVFGSPSSKATHDALEDAWRQTKQVQRAWQHGHARHAARKA